MSGLCEGMLTVNPDLLINYKLHIPNPVLLQMIIQDRFIHG